MLAVFAFPGIALQCFRLIAWSATATLLSGCARRAEAPKLSRRPNHMPCAIVGKRDYGSLTFTKEYRLYYQQDGQMEFATEETIDAECKAPERPCWVSKREQATIRYRYHAGVLTDVQRTCQGPKASCLPTVLSIGYAEGRPTHYSFRAVPSSAQTDPQGANKPEETTIQVSATGEIETITHARSRFPKPQDVETRSTFVGRHEPFFSSPIVWPFSPDTIYFGWEVRDSQVKQMALLNRKETFTYGEDGRIASRSIYPDYLGVGKLEFHYDCPTDIPADRVSVPDLMENVSVPLRVDAW